MIPCPGCGAGLKYDIESRKMKCEYCSGLYDPALFAEISEDAETVTDSREGKKNSDSDGRKSMKVASYLCPQCGAELVTADETDITAVCSYCGGANIIFDRMRKMRCPDYIIPFQLTKEQCKAAYIKEANRSIFTPHYMKKAELVDSFKAIYMPYWTFDIEQKGKTKLDGKGVTSQDGDYRVTQNYNIEGEVDVTYKGIAHDASSAFDDGISECLAPFDPKDRIPFNPAYLSGFYADAPDVDAKRFEEDAIEIAKENTMNEIREKELVDAYSREVRRGDLSETEIPSKIIERSEAFYPVWFMSYRRGDKITYAAINGQTGKVAADLPISPLRFVLFFLLLSVGAFALLNGLLVLKPGAALAVVLILLLAGVFICNAMVRELIEKILMYESESPPEINTFGNVKIKRADKKSPAEKVFLAVIVAVLSVICLFAFKEDKTMFLYAFAINAVIIGKWLIQDFRAKKKDASSKIIINRKSFGPLDNRFLPIWNTNSAFKILGIVETVIGAVIIMVNPVVNKVFYAYSFFAAATFLAMALFTLIAHGKLSERRPPQFNKRGGDDNA